jgi:SAM-dependent methyltransferase
MGFVRGCPYPIPPGTIRFGDLKRTSPISDNYGLDRGTPVDRYYIERFLAENASDIRGRVLELHDNAYTRRFGGARVERSEILSVEDTNPRATIIGDLAQQETLPEASLDCIILTQVLQCIFDLESAINTLHRALKPGGVLLVTVPGISRMKEQWPWYWTFTAAAMEKLLQRKFGLDAVTVEEHGNVFAATAFLYGLALEELDVSDLIVDDTRYPVTVAARAFKH